MFAVGDKVLYKCYGTLFPCKISSIDILRGDPVKKSDGSYSMNEYSLKCQITARLPSGEKITDSISEFFASI